MQKCIFAIVVGCLATIPTLGQLNQEAVGVIRGVVVNEIGQYIVGAKVNANLMDHRPRALPIRFVETDNDGRFTIDRLEWGSYRIYAMKEAERYPDSSSAIYSNGLRVTANLSAQAPSANVVVVIGPKAGELTGSISDVLTGKPVHAGIRIWRSKGDFFSTSTPPEYHILIPASTEVGLEVRAPGYEVWRYPGDAGSPEGKPLLLKSGETLNVDIRLQPKIQ